MSFPALGRGSAFVRRDKRRFQRARQAHARALEKVKRHLKERSVPYKAVYQARRHDYAPYALIISVGGDGTFLEAARRARSHQLILGVNSDPQRSAGSFCAADGKTFGETLDRVLEGKAPAIRLNRLQLKLNGRNLGLQVVNDILVTHGKPAAMSRYWLEIGSRQEEQRSSGLWISTAAGSTGAIKSAGGRSMDRRSQAVQYRPRELYQGVGLRCRLKGGVTALRRPIRIGSLMQEGLICVDGEHLKVPFRYGDLLEVVKSPHSLRLIGRLKR